MEIRGPYAFNAMVDDQDRRGIDCEFQYPGLGWLPISLDATEHPEEYAEALAESPAAYVEPPISTAQVDVERDRRLYGGVTYAIDGVEHTFDSDLVSQQRIDSMAALARFAVAAGALADDYRWHGGTTDFQWITADNALVTMDAIEMVSLGDRFVQWISGVVFSGRVIKNLDPIPADYADDSRWPT